MVDKKKKEEDPELTPEEVAALEAESKAVEEEKARKLEEKRKQQEEAGKRMYSAEEVSKLIAAEVSKQMENREKGIIEAEDEDPFAQKTVRIPRFLNKFIIGFKNTNADEYNPEALIQAFDVYNSTTQRNEAYVTVIFDELEPDPNKEGQMRNKEMNLPLFTVINKSAKIPMDLVEVVELDRSYKTGKTEVAVVAPGSWNASKTGSYVNMKVTQFEYTYKVKFPDGKIREVGREVINW